MPPIYKSKETKYRLKFFCEKNRISYNTLASELRVHHKTVYDWANIGVDSDKSIPGDHLIRLAARFKTSIEKLHSPEHYKSLKEVAA